MEQEYGDDDSTFGCAVVYGVLLALAGVVFAAYALFAGTAFLAVDIPADIRAVRGAFLLCGLLAVIAGAGLWQGYGWAWWLVLSLHSLGALLGLAVALLPLFVDTIGGRPLSGLATPATALMGVVVNVVIVAWFWRSRVDLPED